MLRGIGKCSPQKRHLGGIARGRSASTVGGDERRAQNVVASTGQQRPLAARRRHHEPGIARLRAVDESAARMLQKMRGKAVNRCTRP